MKQHNLIEKNQHIVIGLSGGPDSVCLFHLLWEISEDLNLTIHPVHINHKLRPGAAEEDQKYVENLCKSKGLTCKTFVYDCKKIAAEKKITSEEAGREVRYSSFAQVAEELVESGVARRDIKIAVAHNADDQAETILFRILRGAGIDGIAGMSYKRTDQYGNEIIRPLMDIYKKDILDYCQDNKLNPCIDKTNEEAIYTRNKIRLELIPNLEENFNSNIKDGLIRLGKAAAMDKDFLNDLAEKTYEEAVKSKDENSILLDGEILKRSHQALRQRVISKALIELGLDDDVTFAHFDGASGIVENSKPSARMDLPKGYYITKVYDDVKIAREITGESNSADEGIIKVSQMTIEEYKDLDLPKNSHGAFDKELLESEYGPGFEKQIVLRKRLSGDYINLGKGGTKKLQNYLVDEKVPKDERDQVNLLAIGNEILWILPKGDKGRYSGKYKLCDTTKIVIYVELFGAI